MNSLQEGELAILVADNSLALYKFGWKPRKGLSDMCKDGFGWISKNPYGYDG